MKIEIKRIVKHVSGSETHSVFFTVNGLNCETHRDYPTKEELLKIFEISEEEYNKLKTP